VRAPTNRQSLRVGLIKLRRRVSLPLQGSRPESQHQLKKGELGFLGLSHRPPPPPPPVPTARRRRRRRLRCPPPGAVAASGAHRPAPPPPPVPTARRRRRLRCSPPGDTAATAAQPTGAAHLIRVPLSRSPRRRRSRKGRWRWREEERESREEERELDWEERGLATMGEPHHGSPLHTCVGRASPTNINILPTTARCSSPSPLHFSSL
jgi:hypothetical protein